VELPQGFSVAWSGQFEYLERTAARLKIVVPLTLVLIFLLLYLNFRALTETLVVMLSLPFALVGGIWLMWWLGFNLSVAVARRFHRAGQGRQPGAGRRTCTRRSRLMADPDL
jgi:Cu(I)/Ag(I) efflux system membrane protein CusA/SilA